MKQVKHKVFAYTTNSRRLLLFTHLYAPEAGIQVPAGTIEVGESPEEAVLREAFHEIPPLVADHDRMIPELLARLALKD